MPAERADEETHLDGRASVRLNCRQPQTFLSIIGTPGNSTRKS